MRRRRLAVLGLSLALHVAALGAVLVAVARETRLGALFIDLAHWVESEAARAIPVAGARAGGPGSAQHVARALDAPVRRRAAPADAPAPSPTAPASPAPAEAAPSSSPPLAVETAPALMAAAKTSSEGASGVAPGTGAAGATSTGAGAAAAAGIGGNPARAGARGGEVGSAPDVSRGLALVTPGSGGSIVAPGAEYGPYLTRLRQRVQEALRYPPAARRRNVQGAVGLEILIRPDGTLGAVTLADSSGHAVLDEAALETVRSLRPEPFPAGVPPRLLRVRLPVVFTLE
jgi:protein TonB